MSRREIIGHNIRQGFESISQLPTDWPFIFFLPIVAAILMSSRRTSTCRRRACVRRLILAFSIVTLLGCLSLEIYFVATSFLTNSYATLFAMTAWYFHLGHEMYSSANTQAPYSLPYGPYGFIITSWFQQALGPSIPASKVAPFVATLGSSIFLYLSLRARVGWLGALFLTALCHALLLPFDPFQYWPRPDPFLLFAISGGLWASTRQGAWPLVVLGCFIGFAVNLKVYSLIFFFVPIVISARSTKPAWAWSLALIALALMAALPFLMPEISIIDYFRIVKMDSNTFFQNMGAIQSAQWCVILLMIGFSPLLVHRWNSEGASAVLWSNRDICGALMLSLLFVSYPCCEIDVHHLMPLIPVSAYLAAHLYRDISPSPLVERAATFAGASMFLSMVCFIALYVMFLDINAVRSFRAREVVARERIEDIKRIYSSVGPCILLNVSGSVPGYEDDYSFRAILVFNGMPIGIDSTASMDYKYFGRRDLDLERCLAEIRSEHKLPIVCICENGTLPFAETSYFSPQGPVFSGTVISDFYRNFKISGRSSCFDVYTYKGN